MSKLVIGLLILAVLLLFFLLFWMITLSFALLLSRRKEYKDESLLPESSEPL